MKKERLEKFLSVVFSTVPMTFPKTENTHYSDIKDHSYRYDTEFTNSNCLVKRI